MKVALGIIFYLIIGVGWLILAVLVCKKLKLRVFWDTDIWGDPERTNLEVPFLLGWPLSVSIGIIALFLYVLKYICTLIVGEVPHYRRREPEEE
jgi:uncharacterized membrane protein